MAGDTPDPRRGMPEPRLTEDEFKRRFRAQFIDPAFEALAEELERLAAAAWTGYCNKRKSPRTRKAGAEFAEPGYDLAVDWLAARAAVAAAQQQHDEPSSPARFLLVNGSSRSEHTCPGEMSKSYRLLQLAREVIEGQAGTVVDVLDLARLASEYGRRIYPCKACFSTAAPLCHWPCSCYPNYSLGQTQDWMNEIYPLWVAAHGVLIVTPVNWYHASSCMKLMIDRLVCADGGNPDPTRTHGKDARLAKRMELDGWSYPRPLSGRLFACVVHGDTEGAQPTRQNLCDWLRSLGLVAAGDAAVLERYIGYWKPYAVNHQELDADQAMQQEVRNAALTLARAVQARRARHQESLETGLVKPRDK